MISNESTLQIIKRLAYREHRENRDPKNRYRMICPVCNHVPRGGGFTSFSIQEDQNQWYCFTCGNGGGPKEMLGHLGGDIPMPVALPDFSAQRPSSDGGSDERFQGVRLHDLAKARRFSGEFLKTLRWRHLSRRFKDEKDNWYEIPCIEIPYFDQEGKRTVTRFRVGLDEGQRFIWRRFEPGQKAHFYGLWDLDRIRGLGWVIIVEGETDFATLYNHEFPVLAVPGASMWNKSYSDLLQGLEVYLWHEPDTGGDTLLRKVAGSIPQFHLITPPEDAKDPSELHVKLDDDAFKERMNQLIDGAAEYIHPEQPKEATEDQGLFTDEERAYYVVENFRLKRELVAMVAELYPDSPLGQAITPDEVDDAIAQELEGYQTSLWDGNCQPIHRKERKRMAREEDKERGAVLARVGRIYDHIKKAKGSFPSDAHFLPNLNQRGYREKVCIMMENPNQFIDPQDLMFLAEMAWPYQEIKGYREPPAVWKELPNCKRHCRYVCEVDGTRLRGIHCCKLHWDPNCHTEKCRDLTRVNMPDLVGEDSYVEVWLTTTLRYPPDRDDWRYTLHELLKRWNGVTKRIGNQKETKNQLYFRSLSIYYEEDRACIHFKTMLRETFEGQAQAAIDRLGHEMRALEVEVRRFQKGEEARLQLMADSWSHLVGFAPEVSTRDQVDLLKAHVETLKGKHIFQGMGDLYNNIIKMEPLATLVCDECGLKLRQVFEESDRPSAGLLSPTSEIFLWRDRQVRHRVPPPEQGEMPIAAD